MKKIIIFIALTTVFTISIFMINSYFFGASDLEEAEKYIEPELETAKPEKVEKVEKKFLEEIDILENKRVEKIFISYIPEAFEDKVIEYSEMIRKIIGSSIFDGKIISKIDIELFENKIEVRGRLKHRIIKMYGVLGLKYPEFLSVFIHEFGHFIDLYFLEKKIINDPSTYFYDISWSSTKVQIPGQKQADFVSGYSMTNKYEDFAESFAYYVMHNDDFLEKTKKSKILKKKYDFFNRYLFRKKSFIGTDFSVGNKIENYYWDITKIEIDKEKFLLYFKK